MVFALSRLLAISFELGVFLRDAGGKIRGIAHEHDGGEQVYRDPMVPATLTHEGYYTQDDAREIVAYAAERFITVVPEIETPGHSQAMLAAYPEFSCTGGPFEVSTRVGIRLDVLCPGKDRVFEVLDGILDEILDIFPSEVIHIGGDETPRARWKKCPDCQARIAAEGLPHMHALQTYFTNRVAAMLRAKGRSLMGWNEVLSANLDPGAIVQFWKGGTKQMLPHVKKGRKFVMSEFLHVYIDHDYDLLPLHTVYNYDPIPKGLPAEYHQNILGIEVPLWTEWVRNSAGSLAAISEAPCRRGGRMDPERAQGPRLVHRSLAVVPRQAGPDGHAICAAVQGRAEPLHSACRIHPDHRIGAARARRRPEGKKIAKIGVDQP